MSHDETTKDLPMAEYRALSDARTREWVEIIVAEVMTRSDEIGAEIMRLGMKAEREDAGGLQ